MDWLHLGYMVVIFALLVLYIFAFPEFLLVIRRFVSEEEKKSLYEIVVFFFLLSFILFEAGRAVREAGYTDSFIISLGLFFSSITIYTLGMSIWGTWKKKLAEYNIRLLLSRYSLWVIQILFGLTVFFCFILSLVILVKFLLSLF